METESLADDSKSPTVEEETDASDKGPCILLTKRWTFTYGFFMVMLVLFAHRVNMSLAVVCMVDLTVDHHHLNSMTDALQESQLNVTMHTQNVTSSNTDLMEMTFSKYNVSFSSNDSKTGADDLPDSCRKDFGSPIQDLKYAPELKWSRTDVSVLLSSYFYGYILTQIPGGMLTEKYGGKHVISVSMAATMISSLLMPLFARTNLYLAVTLRVVLGLAGGVMIPCLIAMMSHFAPAQERSKMTAFGMSGASVGIIVTFLTSGLLCAYGFDRGWASIFYVHGMATFVLIVYWCLEVYSNPDSHPRISETEKAYISSTNKHMTKAVPTTPWKQIVTSPPVFACVVCHFCYNWSFFTLLINLPLFMKEVLFFDVTQNGIFSSLPYLCMWASMQVCGHLADLVITKRFLSRLTTRRLFTVTSLVGTAICTVATGFVSCDNRMVAVMFLCVGSFFNGPAFGGLFVNHIEVAGVYSGSVYGLTNAIAAIPAMLAPLIVGALTPNGLQVEWRNVFYIAAAVNTTGAIVYACFSRVTLEPWANFGPNDVVVAIETKGNEGICRDEGVDKMENTNV